MEPTISWNELKTTEEEDLPPSPVATPPVTVETPPAPVVVVAPPPAPPTVFELCPVKEEPTIESYPTPFIPEEAIGETQPDVEGANPPSSAGSSRSTSRTNSETKSELIKVTLLPPRRSPFDLFLLSQPPLRAAAVLQSTTFISRRRTRRRSSRRAKRRNVRRTRSKWKTNPTPNRRKSLRLRSLEGRSTLDRFPTPLLNKKKRNLEGNSSEEKDDRQASSTTDSRRWWRKILSVGNHKPMRSFNTFSLKSSSTLSSLSECFGGLQTGLSLRTRDHR